MVVTTFQKDLMTISTAELLVEINDLGKSDRIRM
ncbi:unnamed protein product [Heterotrigona itama]|uniref:Uncharacterized protein n=1 Tax=Heterotrigona itama TaxID=395501 RepID=A0A6V7GZW8_9HYME|nr:unnamed protein product [Heterotrigona itama]